MMVEYPNPRFLLGWKSASKAIPEWTSQRGQLGKPEVDGRMTCKENQEKDDCDDEQHGLGAKSSAGLCLLTMLEIEILLFNVVGNANLNEGSTIVATLTHCELKDGWFIVYPLVDVNIPDFSKHHINC